MSAPASLSITTTSQNILTEPVSTLILQAPNTNTADITIHLGSPGVAVAGTGYILSPGKEIGIVHDRVIINNAYAIAASGTQNLKVTRY